jgi:hypothetical protein
MRDATTYRRCAEECQRLANTMSKENRLRLLEISDSWLALAVEAEKLPPTPDPQRRVVIQR